jgi:hypothetical protein
MVGRAIIHLGCMREEKVLSAVGSWLVKSALGRLA